MSMSDLAVSHAITRAEKSSSTFGALLVLSLRAHAVFFAICLVYLALTIYATSMIEGGQTVNISNQIKLFILVTIPVLLLAIATLRFLYISIYVRPKHPIFALALDLKEFLSDKKRLANGVPLVLALLIFMNCYAQIKVYIPLLHPFDWDKTFMQVDQWMHFGWHPWEILHPIMGYPIITFLTNISYNVWFMVMWVIWVALAFQRHPDKTRTQFFIAFLLCWSVGGSLMATMLSSAGPCFYSHFDLGPDPYAPLMAYLYDVHKWLPLWALDTQEILWAAYKQEQDIIAGISAMPSMHNTTAVLMALLGWRISRNMGIGLTIFAVLIFLGSVHLGWHYAVDGYVGLLVGLCAWWIGGFVANWVHKDTSVLRYEDALSAIKDEKVAS